VPFAITADITTYLGAYRRGFLTIYGTTACYGGRNPVLFDKVGVLTYHYFSENSKPTSITFRIISFGIDIKSGFGHYVNLSYYSNYFPRRRKISYLAI